MKIGLLFFLFSSVWLILSHRPQEEKWSVPTWADTLTNPFANNAKAAIEGKKIYESACWSCHGISGKGDGPASKTIVPKPADHTNSKVQSQSDGALYWKITKGKGKMVPYERVFSKQQRWKLVTYIRTLKQ